MAVSCLTVSSAIAQNQSVADSLVQVYEVLDENDTARFRILTLIANNQTDPRKKLEYADLLVNQAREAGNIRFLHHGYLNQGQAYRLMGDFDVAIYALFKALDFAGKSDYGLGIAASNTALADVYSVLGNHVNAVLYYKKGVEVLEFKKSLEDLNDEGRHLKANILLNLGDEYYMSHRYDSALACFEASRQIYEGLKNSRSGLAYALGNIGLVQAELGMLREADQNINKSILQLEKLEDHYGRAIFLSYLAEIYQRKGLLAEAKSLADSSMAIAMAYGLKTEMRDNSLRLADIYAMSADYETAFKFHRQYVALKDSIANDEIYNRIQNLESAFELAKKQAEVDLLLERQKNQQIIITTTIIVAVVLIILAIVTLGYYRSKAKINTVLQEQKRALESLNQTKDKFFSIISHDLRGPVSSFHGISRMIKFLVTTKETDQLLEIADTIDQSVDRLSSLLDNLLNWAMQQQGHFPNIPERLNMRELMDDLVQTMANMAAAKNINLQYSIHEEILLWADRNMTMTILRNLVNNALKFSQEGGKVEILAHEKESYAEIVISDNGVGIPQEKLDKLFGLQDQKSTFGTAGEKGLGLGLHLVNEFIEMNNGKISVTSSTGKGTVFTILLPLFEKVKVKEEI